VTTNSQDLLQLNGIVKNYPGVTALDGISLGFRAGEIHALVGENGAGKSTLAQIIAGSVQPDVGEMSFAGEDYTPTNKRESELLGIRMVMQELNLIPTLTVAENVFLNRLPSSFGLIDNQKLMSDTRAVLSNIGIDQVDAHATVSTLGIGQQQMVEIAAGLSERCQLLILDEPTAALTASETSLLFNQIQTLRDKGVCIIYISHRMTEIKQLADRITVLRDGKLVKTCKAHDIDTNEIIHLMVGRELGQMNHTGSQKWNTKALQVKNLSRADVVRNVSFDLYKGEILGFAGMMGSGRSELMRLIFGADSKDAGQIFLHNSRLETQIRSPKDAINAGVALITEDRKEQGLLLSLPVSANISLTRMSDVSNKGFVQRSKEEAVAESYRSRLSIKCHSIDQEVKTLSGGNQQKVVIAKWLYRDADILIFDEPTRGIDVGAKIEIYNLLKELIQEGRSIIVVSSDMPELMTISDRIAVMSEGVLAKIYLRDEWTEDKIMEAALSNYSPGKAG